MAGNSNMKEYQVIARKYRPQNFQEVLDQEPTVTTLVNAIKRNRLAHAYIFSGSRGTGKTTLARILAKTLNCQNKVADDQPCDKCSNCLEISASTSLDVLEIDGASNRGIDDIRKINETVGYKPSFGYKIYIIDEVHMLTKEAFNALLKTLEEPPEKVKFFFATTEVNKVPATIISRCQRFNLNRIPKITIIEKLKSICLDMKIDVEEEAIDMIASHAKGGLRDAESLLDQIISFHEDDRIAAKSVAFILGAAPREVFLNLDIFGKEGKLEKAFEISHELFSQGKDLVFFIESLTEHFRNLLAIKLLGVHNQIVTLSDQEKTKYQENAKLYRRNQLLETLDYLVKFQSTKSLQTINQVTIEAILLHIMRMHQRIPIDILVRRLSEFEEKNKSSENINNLPTSSKKMENTLKTTPPKKQLVSSAPPTKVENTLKTTPPKQQILNKAPPPSPQKEENKLLPTKKKCQYDTLVQFAAVELGGTIQQNRK